MSDDLRAGLDALVRQTAAETITRTHAGHGLHTPTITARARRGRRRRTTLATATSIAAITAIVFAGIAAAGPPHPQPAAPTPAPTTTAPTPSTSPTPSSTPTLEPAVALPVGDPSLPFGACGSLVSSAPEHPVSDVWRLALQTGAATLQAGSVLPVQATLDSGQTVPDRDEMTPGTGPQLLIARDGIVVGVADLYGPIPSEEFTVVTVVNRLSWPTTYMGAIGLSSCAPGATDRPDGGALPAGDYTVYGILATMALGDAWNPTDLSPESLRNVADTRPGDWRTAMSDPLALTIAGTAPAAVAPAAEAAPDSTRLAEAPVCGSSAPTAPSANRDFTVHLAEPPSTLPVGGRIDLAADLTYSGPGRVTSSLAHEVEFWAVRDGVVVGFSPLLEDGLFANFDIASGTVVPRDTGLRLRACDGTTSTDEDLPAGSYTVYPGIEVNSPTIRTTTGTSRPTGGRFAPAALGQPFALTVQ